MEKEVNRFWNKKTIILIVLIIAFILISFFIKNRYIASIDNSTNSWITTIQINFFLMISTIISYIFDTYGVIIISILAFLFLFYKGKRKEAIVFLSIVVLSALSITIFKNIFMIPRPINARLLETDFSYPSGHSSISAVLFGFLSYFYYKTFKKIKPKEKPIILIMSILGIIIIPFSRLYLNVHWTIDLIGGLINGFIWLLIGILALDYKKKKIKQFF